MDTIDVALQKLPPQNIEAEQSVLGAILMDNAALNKAIEIVDVDDFYKDTHRRIYTAMLDLYEKGDAIDLITLTDHLQKKGELELIGGSSYLAVLVNIVPTAANIKYHSKLVHEKAMLRNLINTATEIVTTSYENSHDVEELLDYAEKNIFAISE
ncbi:MAG: replicative DNA helicase, partial [Nitrospirae bacterium]|nr:replicative DNA helicase [Nitrospirota bacterium]